MSLLMSNALDQQVSGESSLPCGKHGDDVLDIV
jgi:hypothetical protein